MAPDRPANIGSDQDESTVQMPPESSPKTTAKTVSSGGTRRKALNNAKQGKFAKSRASKRQK